MADVVSIHPADLRTIENNLKAINNELDVLHSNVSTVNDNISTVYDEVQKLAEDFYSFVGEQMKANNKQNSQQRIIQLNQDIEKRFGHYDIVRRHTTGILQADDLGIVKKDVISNASEEIMISTPGYWLAPCLVALAAWINNDPELADKALKEAIKRNDEKTSLFFALICRRADRKAASLKWTRRYLENQDEANLDRKTIIILDAFASGLLGADTDGLISKQIDTWLEHLSEKPGFVEQQTKQWSDAINLKKKPLGDTNYKYLPKYSPTWPVLKEVMEGARLHADLLAYFINIYEQKDSTAALKVQLDETLDSLVTDYDDEELPLKKEKRYHEFVVQFNGDTKIAQQHMDLEESAFETHKDFTQLLTDAAMKPESSNASVSTQKFAIALSKPWIQDAYNDVVAKNRMHVPNEIQVTIDTFKAITTDGQNETAMIAGFNAHTDREKADALSKCVMSGFDNISHFIGIGIIVLGIILGFTVSWALAIVVAIIGGVLIGMHFKKKKTVETNRQNIEAQFEERRKNGIIIIRAILAEVVDYRAEFATTDAESEKVVTFLEELTPDQYIRKLANTPRRINV
ncbi:MAG: hypothetical protein IKV76_00900 [Clostridia bacterium]|nr:hypothetical protein [Clostridia bacterium]